MKIVLETQFDVGQKVYYIAEIDGNYRYGNQTTCGECGTKHYIYPPKLYKVYESIIEHICISGENEYDHVFIDRPHILSYKLTSGWYAKDNHLFFTKEEAEKHLDDKERRLN